MKILLYFLLWLPFVAFGQQKISLQANATISINGITAPVNPCGTFTPTVRTLNTTSTNEIYRPNGSSWQPGDTLVVNATYLTVLEIYGNIGGTPCRPIIIRANTSFQADVIRFKGGAHDFKLISNGSGTDTTAVRSITSNNVALSICKHIEINGLEISGGSIGWYNKVDPVYSDPTTWGINYVQTGNKLIGCWIHDIDGEGVYSGNTSPYGYATHRSGDTDTLIVPIVTDSTIIAYNRVERCKWDGIQHSNGRNGNAIWGNIVRFVGRSNTPSQMCGIIMGGNSAGPVWNNTIDSSHGNGIEYFGYGPANVTGNTIKNAGEASFFANSYNTTSNLSDPLQAINFSNNHIANPPLDGAIRMYNDFRNHAAHTIQNNTFCIPGAPGNWQDIYFTIYTPPVNTMSNNTLLCP